MVIVMVQSAPSNFGLLTDAQIDLIVTRGVAIYAPLYNRLNSSNRTDHIIQWREIENIMRGNFASGLMSRRGGGYGLSWNSARYYAPLIIDRILQELAKQKKQVNP